MIQTISAWSISRLFEFELCPYRAYLRHIAKAELPELPPDHPMLRGQVVHKECETYIAGGTDEFPSAGKKLKETLEFCREQFAEGKASVEDKWGFRNDWSDCDWMASDVWLRMATDCTVFVEVIDAVIYDWKTGKSYGNEVKYMQQSQLYACGAFMKYPNLERINVGLGFLDEGKVVTKSFERGPKIYKLIKKFEERGNRMVNCVDFRPKPNAMNCKYCPFGPATGTGVCIYGVGGL